MTIVVVETADKKGSKRRKSGMNVFQLAETVEVNKWESVKQEELKVCEKTCLVYQN